MEFHTKSSFSLIDDRENSQRAAELSCYYDIGVRLVDLNSTSYTVTYTIAIKPHEYYKELNYVQIDAQIRVNHEAR